jgi:hypothetical protein
LEQAKHVVDQQKENGIATESWQMAGASFYIIQGTISRATLHDEIQSNKLSCSLFMKYFTNRSGDIGITFNGCNTTLSVPWHDVIYYSHIIKFFGKCFDQLHLWGPVF